MCSYAVGAMVLRADDQQYDLSFRRAQRSLIEQRRQLDITFQGRWRFGYRCDWDRLSKSDKASHACASGIVVRYSGRR
ncbi:MAG: hypothetical protein Q8N35_11060 [Methylococcaceae bacterium]|nr:hypothetical protein [Methylococcaceae bacterium]MDP2394326.1 hypothetical protein [Methylococcaceae bacterium]MDP3020115.1 hypothetical protein [Methylococcaceae bacterium]MDP3391189.1 hypothetical protein [Methylococcaceae bacterium]MDP3932559.1 hypothetical protein [Methylococcaceae bacterium]